jgi:3-hydroxybutyryl-CoA dehydrogenase
MDFQRGTGIAVIGAGLMGSGIAQVAALAGHPVVVVDQGGGALDQAQRSIDANLASMVRKGRLGETERVAVQSRIAWTTQMADASCCGLAIEAVVEQLDVKRSLFASLAAILPADAVLASNTSSLAIGQIAQGVEHPERVIGLHFFNPVPLMKLVEIIAAPASAPDVIEGAVSLMRRWGKRPVVARDVPGFIVNRVARPYYAEAFIALDEGIPAASIDSALVDAGGFRMGPLALTDMIGHDTNFQVAKIVYEAGFGTLRFRPQAAQRRLVADGHLGRKSGRGVYRYDAELPSISYEAAAVGPQVISLGDPNSNLGTLLGTGAVTIATDSNTPAGIAVVDEVRLAFSDGRPLSARDDVDALLDAVRDPANARSIVFAATEDRAAAVVAGLIQTTGRNALRLPDRAGLIVLRTLAQIANAAADTLVDGVTDWDGVDEAMLHGANHPEGPLAWAARFGETPLAQVLSNIEGATGDPIYRPSSEWQREKTG